MAKGFGAQYTYDRIPPPKNFVDIFRYMKQLLGVFFTRFAYIVKLVWQTGPWILFLLSFIALFKGVTPIIGSLISKKHTERITESYKSRGFTYQ